MTSNDQYWSGILIVIVKAVPKVVWGRTQMGQLITNRVCFCFFYKGDVFIQTRRWQYNSWCQEGNISWPSPSYWGGDILQINVNN